MSSEQDSAADSSTDTENSSNTTMTDDTSNNSAFTAIATAETLESLIEPVSPLVDEFKLHLTKTTIEIRAVDPANVGMVDLTLDATAFESYKADEQVIGLDLTRFANVIDVFSSDTLVELSLDPKTRKLNISGDDLEYTLALIDPDSIREEPDIPDLDLPCEAVVSLDSFEEGVTAAELVGDHIAIGADDDANIVTLSAEGDVDDVERRIREDSDDTNFDLDASVSSLFSLEYLSDMVGGIPSENDTIRLLFGNEFPLKIWFDVEGDAGDATFMLAPRIQNE